MFKLVFIGAGGFAKTLIDSCLYKQRLRLIGFIDETKTGTHLGKPIFGKRIEDVPDYKDCLYFIAIGDVDARKKWLSIADKAGVRLANIIDPTAFISENADVGDGNFIGKHAIVNSFVKIGRNNIINEKALVSPSCVIGDNCNISTGSILNGEVTVGNEVLFGSGAICNRDIRIGNRAAVGSGAVIIEDVPEKTTVVGVPGKVVKKDGVRV